MQQVKLAQQERLVSGACVSAYAITPSGSEMLRLLYHGICRRCLGLLVNRRKRIGRKCAI